MKVILAKPRGFCAGVERAIRCVKRALELYGPPVYVLHDIVHNATVVGELRDEGAVFVDTLDEVPASAHLLFSAHGVGPKQWEQAEARDLHIIDATCPLVEKVHREARNFAQRGYTVFLIGEAGHDEVVGTAGWAPDHIRVVFSAQDVSRENPPDPAHVAYLMQTTLSVDDSAEVVGALRERFPAIEGPPSEDICYATQNRQGAINALAEEAGLVLVVGDKASANSNRLAQICRKKGRPGHLIRAAEAIEEAWLDGVETVLVTSGASAPEFLVQEVVAFFQGRGPCAVEERVVVAEDVHFQLPRELR